MVLVWAGADPRTQLGVQEVLQREGISAQTLHKEDSIFPIGHSPFEIYVSADSAERAKNLLANEGLSPDDLDDLAASGALELPAEDNAPEQPQSESTDELEDWDSDEANTEVWSGDDIDLAHMIAMSLRENDIVCRPNGDESDSGEGSAAADGVRRLYVWPADAARAKRIIREIVDGIPPE